MRPINNRINVKLAMPEALMGRIDHWWHANKLPNRSEAIRILIERGLKGGKTTPKETPPPEK